MYFRLSLTDSVRRLLSTPTQPPFGTMLRGRHFLFSLPTPKLDSNSGTQEKKSIRDTELPIEALQLERAIRFPGRHGYSIPCEHCLHGAFHGFIGPGGQSSSFGH